MMKCSKLFKTNKLETNKMALYLEMNDGFGEYQRKHGNIPDVLFVNNTTAQYMRMEHFPFQNFGKPVLEVTMELPYLWIDNETLKQAKNKVLSDDDKGVEVIVGGLVSRLNKGKVVKSRSIEPLYIPRTVLQYDYP